MVPFFSACGHFGPTFLLLLALFLGLTCFEAALMVLILLLAGAQAILRLRWCIVLLALLLGPTGSEAALTDVWLR